jgi:SAM-dependent methyltransferase
MTVPDPAPDPALENSPFDRRLRRLRRDRAARSGAPANPLLQRMADDLLERLDLVTRRFDRALDLGSGPGHLASALRARGMEVTACDAGALFASGAGGEQCDEDRLPFAAGSFDLVVSAGTLDSVNDLPGALIQVRRLLRPDGLFLAAFAGAGSLPILRSALAAADEAEQRPASPRLHPQIDLRAAGDLLARAGFALPVADDEPLTVRYPGLPQLVADLRSLAWTNLLSTRSRHPFGRLGYAAAQAAFTAAADPDGKVPERFRIVHLSGWAPSPDQPQPARRGSATASLAAALGKKSD